MAEPVSEQLVMMRNRLLFRLYEVRVRNNAAQPVTLLVWAHRMHEALATVEEHVASEDRRHVMTVEGIKEIRMPDSDSLDYARVIWTGGEKTEWA